MSSKRGAIVIGILVGLGLLLWWLSQRTKAEEECKDGETKESEPCNEPTSPNYGKTYTKEKCYEGKWLDIGCVKPGGPCMLIPVLPDWCQPQPVPECIIEGEKKDIVYTSAGIAFKWKECKNGIWIDIEIPIITQECTFGQTEVLEYCSNGNPKKVKVCNPPGIWEENTYLCFVP